MSSHTEGPRNPDDWQNPYGSGQPSDSSGYGRSSGYGTGEPQDAGYQSPPPGYGQPPPGHGQTAPGYDPSSGYGQTAPGYGDAPPGYGQGYGAPYGQPPYGAQGYGQEYGQGYGYGPPPYPRSDGPRTHAIIALVISIVLAMSCYVTPGGLAGAILSGMALSKADYEPERASSLLRWCWISIGINVGLIILGIAGFIVAGVSGAFD